ncbi:DUF2842 domain-containing protein [Jannaschia sp. LMIT008]|uniref:DUF2842 domain-containing protein n=1 Tax=Jannaschia maritima TaxID=3032585 RepID=UPI002811385E|nr:DUF2842 domain-containing protein [Jannaschia sp. LMIT008]
MALSYKARKRWAFFILLIGMPVYVVVAVTVATWMGASDFPVAVEFVMYAVLGIAWVFPFKAIFRGTAKPDPDAPPEDDGQA